jgi:hypothetical protein
MPIQITPYLHEPQRKNNWGIIFSRGASHTMIQIIRTKPKLVTGRSGPSKITPQHITIGSMFAMPQVL